MKIEFLEHDGMLQEDGLPKIVVVSVDGVKFPYETNKSIVELFKDAEKIKHKAPADSRGDGLKRPVESRPGQTIQTNAIQRNDTVRFLGVLVDGKRMGDETGDLKVDGLYKVMEVGKDGVAIIDPECDFPIRLNVKKSDLVLVEKGQRVTEKKSNYEVVRACLCGQMIALELKGDNYEGVCVACKSPMTSSREDALK